MVFFDVFIVRTVGKGHGSTLRPQFLIGVWHIKRKRKARLRWLYNLLGGSKWKNDICKSGYRIAFVFVRTVSDPVLWTSIKTRYFVTSYEFLIHLGMYHTHQRIALTSLPLLWSQQPIWCLCRTRRDTRSRRCMWTMLFCHGGTERCLEEVKIAPTNPTFLALIGHGVMLSWHNAISWPHPVLKPCEQIVQTMNKLMVWFQRRAGWLIAL